MSTSHKEQPGVIPLAAVQEANWRPDVTAPPGISVENLRRRGIDRMRLLISLPQHEGLMAKLFGIGRNATSVTQIITIADKKLVLDPGSEQTKGWPKRPIPFDEVRTVEVSPRTGSSKSLRIAFGKSSVLLGTGLSEESLVWLRDRLLLELAGLVWKPVFNVGRRTTRSISTAEDDLYRQWPTGAPNRLIEAYLSEAPAKAAALDAAIAAQDWLAIKKTVHWLKSSCASVGAVQLSECCQRMEIEIDMRDVERITTLAHAFATEFARVSSTLERIRSSEPVESPAVSETLDEVALEERAAHDHTRTEPAALAGIKVLLVEDSKVNQALATSYLEEAGAEVDIAGDGSAAVEQFEARHYDVIFMDCQMPGMDGFEATRIIRIREKTTMRGATPIIALTANALREDRVHCLACGMSDYLAKPYTKEDIIDIARRWTGRNELAADPAAESEQALAEAPHAAVAEAPLALSA